MYNIAMPRRTATETAKTQRRLVDAAVDVFAECGYAAATLGQIAERADVTRGALYHHFADKAELHEVVLRREADQVTGPLMTQLAGPGPPLQRLHAFVVAYCTALDRDARFRRAVGLLLFDVAGAPARVRDRTRLGYHAWQRAFEAVLDEAQARDELREDIAVGAAAGTVVAFTVGATTAALHAPESFRPAEHADAFATTLVTGLTR
jgi:TetR/AcrR family acrAB operon transcriptional repressor